MGEVVDPSQSLCSPYHVSLSSFVIVPIILEDHWSHLFQMNLITKNNICFIDGTTEAPTHTSLLFLAWQVANMMVVY